MSDDALPSGGVVDIRSLRERQRGVAEADLITVKESEWEQLHAELAAKDQTLDQIRLLIGDAFTAETDQGANTTEALIIYKRLAQNVQRILSSLAAPVEDGTNG